jgi:hypothetical protein
LTTLTKFSASFSSSLSTVQQTNSWKAIFGERSPVVTEQGCQMVYFQTKNLLFLEGLRLENVDILNGHWEYFTDIWDI